MQYLLACIDITFIQCSVSPVSIFFSPSKCKINKACSLIDCTAFPVVLVALVMRKQRPPRAGSGTVISQFIPVPLWFDLSYIWNIYTETNMFQRKSCVRKLTKQNTHPVSFLYAQSRTFMVEIEVFRPVEILYMQRSLCTHCSSMWVFIGRILMIFVLLFYALPWFGSTSIYGGFLYNSRQISLSLSPSLSHTLTHRERERERERLGAPDGV